VSAPAIDPPVTPRAGGSRGRPPTLTAHGRLLVCTLLLLVLQGMVPEGAVHLAVVTALAGATLVLAFRTANASPRLVGAVTVLAVAATGAALVQAVGGDLGDGAIRLVNAGLTLLGPPAVAIGILHELRSSDRVRMAAVSGVLSLYMLLGMFFGFLYGALDRVGDEGFFTDGSTATVSRCLYFSFTTLTTVGYGDLTARSDAGHTLAILEALIGQIYLVTVVALIVGNLGRPARRPA
jgi:Ion channel